MLTNKWTCTPSDEESHAYRHRSRTDLSTEETVTVLRDGLGADYNVLPGMTMGQLPFQGPGEGRPDTAGPAAAVWPTGACRGGSRRSSCLSTGRGDRAGPLSPPPGASRPAAEASPVR